MAVELVSIPTDTTPLDGLFYLPAGTPSGAVLLLHGNTMNFYTGALRFLPPMLLQHGLACLAFNRRGHDILSIRNSRAAEGAAFQTTAEGIADNAIAASWLTQRGFDAPFVIGHSNGGMLAVQHVHDHPDTPGLALLSAHRGGSGPGVLQGFTASGHLAQDQSAAFLEKTQAMVAQGRGAELLVVPGWWYVISAASYVDRVTTMPDILDLAPHITCPVLFIRGDQEARDAYPAEAFQARVGGPCHVEIVPECDHFYNGREATICRLVSQWLGVIGQQTP